MNIRELTAQGVAVGVNGRVLLTHIDLDVHSGTWLTISGPSGSGKSLLLRALSGLQRPQAGEVLVDGNSLYDSHGPRLQPGIVLQDYALVPFLTAEETVALPLQAAGVPAAEIEARVRRWVEQLGLRPASHQVVSNLSGGQRQRVAIARALALESPLLFLDEPTAELDVANRTSVLALLRQRVDQGGITITISHDQSIWEVSDRVMVITSDGQLDRVQPLEG